MCDDSNYKFELQKLPDAIEAEASLHASTLTKHQLGDLFVSRDQEEQFVHGVYATIDMSSLEQPTVVKNSVLHCNASI